MNFPIELVIQCLPKELRKFIVEASLKNYQYNTQRIFFTENEQIIIEKLLYAVDWTILRRFMADKTPKSTRRGTIEFYMEKFKPTLVDVIIAINEMYGNKEMLKSLIELKKIHEVTLPQLVEQSQPRKIHQNVIDQEEDYDDDYRGYDDNDGWVWHLRDGQMYFGEHPECNIPD